MPSSYTTSLRLTLPATGELAGQWGNTVNTGITELLDAAVAGTTTISTWGGAGVAYTLSNNSGTADEARRMFIVATGTPGEAKNVICPAVSKFYVFRNDTTGGFSLTLKTPSGTGVSVPAGQYRFLYCDGTNVVEMFNSVASLRLSSLTSGRVTYAGSAGLLQDSANLTFNGTDLTVSGAVNAGSINATTLDLTNLEVTNIKAKDGTASMTLADATGVATFSANPILNAGTANGVLYLNGSKVATSGTALAFNGAQLAVNGSDPTVGGGQMVVASANANGIVVNNTVAGQSSTLYLRDVVGSNPQRIKFMNAPGLAFVDNNDSEFMRLTSTGLGIGIAPVASSGKLQINQALGTSADSGIRITDNATTSMYLNNTASGVSSLWSSGSLAFGVANGVFSEAMRLTSTGLGIGTSSPVAKLDVNGSQSFGSASYQIGYALNSSTGTIAGANSPFYGLNMATFTGFSGQGIGLHGYYGLLFSTTGTERMRLDSSGNLGIGTSSPASKLDVNGPISVGGITAKAVGGEGGQISLNNTTDTGNVYTFDVDSSNQGRLFTTVNNTNLSIGQLSGTGGQVLFFAGGSERMRLDSSGNLGLGVTPSAWGATYRALDVRTGAVYDTPAGTASGFTFNAIFNGTNWVYKGTGGNATAVRYEQGFGQHQWYTAPSGTAGNAISFTQAMTLDASGNLGVGTTSPASRLNVSGANVAVRADATSGYGGFYANGATGDNAYYFFAVNGTETARITSNATNSLIFSNTSSATERARITSGGYFKASNDGTYVGSTGSYHEMVSNTASNYVAWVRHTATSGAIAGININYSGQAPNDTANEFLVCGDTGANRFLFRSNGGLANYSGNNVNLSDRREKTNFAPAKSYLDTICAIPVQTFEYIDQSPDDPGLTLGVVAQDVQAVAPELVMESNWGTEDNPKMRLSIYQTDLQYALMKCVQELKAELDATKARLAALEAQP